MTEFTVHVDSAAGLGTEDVLERFHGILVDSDALGPAVTMTVDGTLAATFQIECEALDEAARVGALIFGHALIAAGVPTEIVRVDRVEVERECAHREPLEI